MLHISISTLTIRLKRYGNDMALESEVLGRNIPKAIWPCSICPHRNSVFLPLSLRILVMSDYLIAYPSILVGSICIAEIDAEPDGEEAAGGAAWIG